MQRIRGYEDQLQMRSFFQENDVISAEVQNIMVRGIRQSSCRSLRCSKNGETGVLSDLRRCLTQSDGTVHLHTRTVRYGKLENGLLVYVRPSLVRRSKHHFLTLPGTEVDMVLGEWLLTVRVRLELIDVCTLIYRTNSELGPHIHCLAHRNQWLCVDFEGIM